MSEADDREADGREVNEREVGEREVGEREAEHDEASTVEAPDAHSTVGAPDDVAADRLIVLGVDGGGTKTRVVVADGAGKALATFDGPGSALRPNGVEHSADVIAACARDALARAGVPHAVEGAALPKVLYVGVAGAGRAPDAEALRLALAARGVAEEVVVVADAQIALDDAFHEGAGVLLIAGTGSVAFARGPDGTFRRCGGWGPVLGDEGSGAWIGRRACNVATASADGREPESALVGALLTAIDADDPGALIAWAAEATPARFGELVPVVVRVAASGDLRANTLLSLAVEELALHVRTLARALFVDERAAIPVALAGGLLARGGPLRRRVEQRLKTAVPGAQVRQDDVQPARGAVWSALRTLGIEL